MQRTASRTDNRSANIFTMLIIFFAAALPTQLSGQGYFYWNTADKSKPWVTEINPAIVSFQNTEFSIGLKLFHVGFIPDNAFGMRESRISFSAPFYLPYDIGVGVDIRHFTAGIYSEISSALLLSREVYPKLSIGAKIALDHRGFAKDQFNIVDPDDPLINSSLGLNALNLGGGIYWEPGQFRLGMGVDHLNTPNVGLIAESVYPKEVTGAIGYEIGMFTPTLLLHDNGINIEYGFAISFNKPQLGQIRLGYEKTMPVKLEASLSLDKKSQLHYGVDFPNEERVVLLTGHRNLFFHAFLPKNLLSDNLKFCSPQTSWILFTKPMRECLIPA
ncbi:MAG: type IX secretion system membrane protein PorP/SprF [Deferribacteres bacterium]|nr:type IX secretion system membrane protein PorP/SprF [Deferribacteres bacterium]